MFKTFKYRQRIKLFLCIHRHKRSVMHFCDRCQLSAEFDVFAQQMCVVLKNSEKCELCTRHERSCNVVSNVDCKKISVSQNFVLFNIYLENRVDRVMKRVENQRSFDKAALQRFIEKQDRLAEKITKKKHAFSDKQK